MEHRRCCCEGVKRLSQGIQEH